MAATNLEASGFVDMNLKGEVMEVHILHRCAGLDLVDVPGVVAHGI